MYLLVFLIHLPFSPTRVSEINSTCKYNNQFNIKKNHSLPRNACKKIEFQKNRFYQNIEEQKRNRRKTAFFYSSMDCNKQTEMCQLL